MAKAIKEAPESKGKFQDALDKLNKTYGVGTVLTLDSKTTGDYDLISTGSIGFDHGQIAEISRHTAEQDFLNSLR